MSLPNQSEVVAALCAAFPSAGSVSVETKDLNAYANSRYPQQPAIPHAVVVHVNSTTDVVAVMEIANKYRAPIVPYSGGTSLEGHLSGCVVGTKSSICVDLSRMNKIIQINKIDADVVCQAGVTWDGLNSHLKSQGIPLFFPLDPAPGATVGGMISTGCSGTNAVRYGTARGEWFLNLTAVLPSGEVIKTRQRSRKSSAGFDLTKLFIGAEGTLGIVTEATLRLAPLLPTSVAVVSFPTVHQASLAVCEALTYGAAIQCAELGDALIMEALNMDRQAERQWLVGDTVFFKYQGTPAVIEDTSRLVEGIVHKHGATRYYIAASETEAAELWTDRKNIMPNVLRKYPGARGYVTDVCVPLSRLPDLVDAVKSECVSRGLIAPIGGHVGDGNFHAFILHRNAEEIRLVQEVVDHMVHTAIEYEGTCTGEHGVGLAKRKYLTDELGSGTVTLMKTIKSAIDPHNLMNPGKLYPD